MRDIGERIQRYRLSRYAAPEDKVRRRLRWVWLIALVWAAWVGVLSDHNFYRLWRLGQERRDVSAKLSDTQTRLGDLQAQLDSPAARLWLAEKTAREQHGWAKPGEIIYRVDDRGAAHREP
ncbi:MAG TPA: septum formation initiator family protein [Candidatus Eisenbacteria bacterium]|nr:septum formation initiator family protein [Candidatus Eisenbacteria bacterium]